MASSRRPTCLIRCLLSLVLTLVCVASPQLVAATLSATSVTPASLVAGRSGSVAVSFTSDANVPVGSYIAVAFPSGFRIDTTSAVVTVDASLYASTLSIDSVTETQVVCLVGSADVSASTEFGFSISDVTNPGSGSSATFSILIQDGTRAITDSDTAVPPVIFTSAALSNASVTPDSLVAGATGTATVSFTTGVSMPVGSVIVVALPSELSVATTSSLSAQSNVGSGSSLTVVSSSQVEVTVAGSAISAASTVSFKVSGVTNPGATTTGVFSVETMDSSRRVYESASSIVGVVISSSALSSLSVSTGVSLAGVSVEVLISMTTVVGVPALGGVVVTFPSEFDIRNGVSLEESSEQFSIKSGVSTGNVVLFTFDSPMAAGSYLMVIKGVRNPGVCTTGSFIFHSCDGSGRIYEIGTAPGVTITAGAITEARFTPLDPRPGVASIVLVTFTSSAGLEDETLIYVAMPNSDYSLAVGNPTAVVYAPTGVLASVSWDTPNTAFAILLSCSSIIKEGTTVDIAVTALNMPPSIRDSTSSASIQTWNAHGLRLDGPSSLTLDAISAVTTLPAKWSTSHPHPGITSPVVITFDTNGAVPAEGKIRVDVPDNDFRAESNPFPTVLISNPSVDVATVWWDNANSALTVTLAGSHIPPYSTSVTITITSLDTPVSTPDLSRGSAFISTFDTSGTLIDGPSAVSLDAITPGPILGSRLWVPAVPHSGVTCDHTISFFSSGKLLEGSSIEFGLPNTMWSLSSSTATATFTRPALGQSGSTTWNATALTALITLSSGMQIPAYSMISVVLSGVTNPPKETAVTTASLTTRSSNGAIIDGPGIIVIEAITRGSFGGSKTLTSTTTTSASMKSKQVLSLTLGGAVPSGGFFWIKFPSTGWRATQTITATFLKPATGVSVSSVEWSSPSGLLVVRTEGNLDEATTVEIEIDGMMNPYDVETARARDLIEVKSTLADGGVVDEFVDIKINSITASDLGGSASWVSAVATPGVASTQTVNMQTGGYLDAGASICFNLPTADAWTVLDPVAAIVRVTGSTVVNADVVWTSATATLCLVLAASIPQESTLSVEISDVRSPPSERAQSVGTFSIFSHVKGLVNTGSFDINLISRGQLSGERVWQSTFFSPGPVAALATTAALTFATTGQIQQNGRIALILPIEWQLDASTCGGDFLKPSVVGTVSCSDNTVTVDLMDAISEYTVVKIRIRGVVNPPTVLPAGTASLQTLAADGGVIDGSFSVSTGAIESALIDIVSVTGGDTRVAVVGVSKMFFFQGFSVREGDVVKFVDYSTTGDANCGPSTSGVSDVGGIDIAHIDSSNQAQFKFMQSSLDNEPFALCYKFGSNPFKLYRTLSFTVKELQSVSVSEGESSVAVANYPKTWTFHGRGLATGDLVRWIDASAVQDALASGVPPDCLDTAILARLVTPDGETFDPTEDEYTRAISNTNGAKFVFSAEENADKTFYVCYRFGNEPYKVYSGMSVRVNHVRGIAASAWGDDSVAVVDLPKPFNLLGEGLVINDRLYFIEVGSATSCSSSAFDPSRQFAHTINDQLQTVLFLSGTSSTVVNFTPSAAGKKAMLCYQFGSEPYQLYPGMQLEVKMVTSFTGARGSPKLAVGDIPEPLTFQGYGLREGDQVRWIHSAEEDCDTHLALVVEPGTLVLIDTVNVDASTSATFNFSSRQDEYRPVLCYKFANEKFKLYTSLSIKIGILTAKSTVIGSKEVAVVDARKTFKLYGTYLAERDRVAWTRSPFDSNCENATLLVPDPMTADSEYVSFTTIWGEVSVAFAPLNSGKRVFLCYGFGSEPYKLYPNLFIDVKSVQNLRTIRGASDVAVAGALKTFLFEGDGVATGDFAKFVVGTNTDCSAPGVSVTNLQKEFDDEVEMAVYLYENIPRITVGSFRFSSTDPEAAGLARVLCYRFGTEQFVFYKNFRVDVKTISKLRQYDAASSGQATVAVVDEFKLIAIDGVGVAAVDTVKWVDGDTAQSDQACEDLLPQGLFARTISVFANGTMWFPFEYGTQGKSWKLCYKFDQEPFRLYESITVTVKEITDLLDFAFQNTSGLGQTAVIGQMKTWKPIGSGVMHGDTVKFVPLSVSSSAECGIGTANIAGGSDLMAVTGASELTFAGMLTSIPVSLSDVYHVCYRFQDEPFSYIKGLEIASYGIWAVDRKTILSKASTPLRLNGFRLSNVDRLGWTEDRSEDGCLRVFNVADVFESQATVVFDQSYNSLTLCYSFDRQPFSMFKSITISVVAAEVWVPQSVAIVAGQTVEFTLSGTFGLTVSSDQVAWVPADALACSQDVMDEYLSVIPSTVLATSASSTSLARGGTSVLSVTFAPSTTLSESLSTWKLCYKFGNVPDYLMFGDVLCDVLSIQRVGLLESRSTPLGTTITFQFSGLGIQDFDVAKWIDLTTTPSDSDCESLPPVGGSAIAPIVAGVASFDFNQAITSMALCYRFSRQAAFKLFNKVPIKDLSRSAGSFTTGTTSATVGVIDDTGASTRYVPNRDLATVTLRLDKDINDIPSGSVAEDAFKAAFTTAISSSLGIDASRIEILELIAGSVIVKFQLKPSDSVADPLVRELVEDLQAQLLDPQSTLLANNGVIAIADPNAALNFEMATLSVDDSSTNSARAIAVRGYQPNGLFTFASDAYSVTEKTGRLFIKVLRQQGVNAVVTLPIRLASPTRTATLNVDYRIVAPSSNDIDYMFLRFDIGDQQKTIEIEILDDTLREAHFEYFTLILGEPGTPDSALGAFSETTVRIFDFDDGLQLAQTAFPAPTDRRFNLLGWSVVENGRTQTPTAQLRVDSNGIFAIDQVVGVDEYNQKCDLASPTGACAFACEVGASLTSTADVLASYRVLSLTDGKSFVTTVAPVASFATRALTVSFWIRTTSKTPTACIVAYSASPSASQGDRIVDLAVCDPTNLRVAIESEEIDAENKWGRRGALTTFVDVTDGMWHFVAVTWNTDDGRVKVFDNGMLAFDGGPYRVGHALPSNGFVVVGQLVTTSSCSKILAPNDASSPPVACSVEPKHGLVADLQHVSIWTRVLSRGELLKQLQWPIKVVTNGLVLSWNFDLFTDSGSGLVTDITTHGAQAKNHGYLFCSAGSAGCTTHGVVPTVAPGFPCGPVYANVWHFVAPSAFKQSLPRAYGGRLQFRMLAPSQNGVPRSRRGQVSLFGAGLHLSVALGGFPLPRASGWTYYSVVLREDFGWLVEPTGEAATASEFQEAVGAASALWIRGDLWGPGTSGQGQEVVYLNDIKLFTR